MIGFAHPWALLLLLLIPLYAFWLRSGGGGATAMPVPRAAALQSLGRRAWRLAASVPEILRSLAFAALVVALAGPRTGARAVDVRTEGIPMMIAIDVSSSMLAEDFAPRNRLEVARETVSRFIAGRESDPIGLVAFAGEAITQAPPTLDYPVLFAALENLQVGLLEDGTAIGMGLAAAANRLRRAPGESKVVILMSDGENNRGDIDPLAAARAAEAYGIRVFTIGVGSEEPAPIPIRGDSGVEYAELSAGLDEELLRGIAGITGGRYFRATNPEALQQIYDRIDRLVRTPVESRRFVRYTDRFLPFVLFGALMLLAEWGWRGSRWGRVP